ASRRTKYTSTVSISSWSVSPPWSTSLRDCKNRSISLLSGCRMFSSSWLIGLDLLTRLEHPKLCAIVDENNVRTRHSDDKVKLSVAIHVFEHERHRSQV